MKLRENVVRFPSRAQIPKLPSVACHSVMSWPDVTGSAPKHVHFAGLQSWPQRWHVAFT